MTPFSSALWVEAIKARRSKVLLFSLVFFAFVGVMMGLMAFVAMHPEIAGRSSTLGAKASVLPKADWPHFLALLIQAILALGPLGYGVVTSWVFGREYADRTVKDLLALPVRRSTIVSAKFVVVVLWSVILAITFFGIGVVTGIVVGLPGLSPSLVWNALAPFSVAALLTILLCTPVAFIASAGRGYLLAIGVVILLLIMTQLLGTAAPGMSIYFPWAVPALCSGVAGSALPPAGPVSWIILIITSILGYVGTAAWWELADQR